MTRPTLLVCDLDLTLAQSPPAPLDASGAPDFAAWERLLDRHPEPVPGAHEGLRPHLAAATAVVVLTARSERLRVRTVAWLGLYMPHVVGYVLDMRPAHEEGEPSHANKLRRLRWRRQALPEARVVLIDDDERMRAACGEGDTFHHAPGCWAVAT